VVLEAAAGVSWGASELYLPGMCAAAGRGPAVGRREEATGAVVLLSHCVRLRPAASAYGPENVAGGPSRAEGWTNLWASDPGEPLPQWIEVQWDRPVTIRCVELTFDTQTDRLVAFGPTPECVRDYDVEVRCGEAWKTVAGVRGNYGRKRRHEFGPAEAGALRIMVRATNGAPDARIFEVRAY
jgi:hypothetical protein